MKKVLSKDRTNIIGITGGIGAGKSTVLDYIDKHYNCLIIYSDDVANDIKKKGYPAYDELVAFLGEEILGSDGEIDKAKMASAIFNDKNKLKTVNNILHPAVNTFIINNIDREKETKEHDFVFVEAALLIENGYDRIADELWYVYADEDVRRQRLKSSRGYSDEKITDIFSKQLDDETFRKHCEFVIDNSGDLSYSAKQIDDKIGDWRE
ncbi:MULTISPECIES: dephospho-CoA kinase [unclassified Butyrivibrio]|uniref:dephospho-CoA kinase n=1 Tax=unclassified Butyrivibrio TaxID=2639466 RepID=UPI0003B5241F|nr:MULTISPECIES: dephospho-CoA kinase [unclassified Butyrivibrio]MDC7295081.1 dephospho-CoA kinase [Butyrivibrio sp. DSM 10294]